MVVGFAITAVFRALLIVLMALVILVPLAAAAASVWFVFWKMGVTVGQCFAVCLMQFVCYVAYLILHNIAQNPPTAG